MAGLLDERTTLPAIGNGIDYRPFGGIQDKWQMLQPHLNTLRSNIETAQRIQSGQIGPEIGQLLAHNNILRKPLQKGLLDLDVNYMNPYIGFTYRF